MKESFFFFNYLFLFVELGCKESSKATHKDSLLIAEIEDELRRQIGVVYPQDN